MKLTLRIVTFAVIMLLLTACGKPSPRYIIGVSQCSDDIWREKQNAELRMGCYFHDGTELRFASAYDSDQRQIEQIDSLVASGIDLLIVAPNQVSTISPAIDRAYDKGIPVIVFERKTNSKKYTAFMGADNYEMGRLMGEYIANRLKGRGRVLEVMGLKGSSPAIDRDRGFHEAIGKHPQIELVATLQGDWTEQSGYHAVKNYKGDLNDINFVFGQNDRMALGARKVFMERYPERQLPLFCGIDGLTGEGGGIACVRDSILDASYIYPTHGDELLQLAVDILDGKPYNKEVKLKSAIVTSDNANVLLLQNEEVIRQSQYLDQLHVMADAYLQQLDAQRTINILAIGLVALLLAVIVSIYLYFLQRARIHMERTKMEREQLDFYTQVSHELRTPLTLIEGPLAQLGETSDIQQASAKASGLFAIIQRNTHQLTQLVNKMLDAQVNEELRIKNEKFATALPTTTGGNADSGAEKPTSAAANSSVFSLHSSFKKSENAQLTTVLIVDDNADIRAYLRTILQDKYQVNEAADGQQGLTLANEIVPDLIVSDVMMPVMNGLEFCQRIKNSTATSHIPVILLTARALSQHQIEGYESGADAYITKPFDADLLLVRIGNLLKSREQLKSLFKNEELRIKNEGNEGNEGNEELRMKNEEFATALPTTAGGNADSGAGKPTSAAANSSVFSLHSSFKKEDPFLQKFLNYIEKNMSDSDLSVETIGAELGLSRVQLYRKMKALTGLSPVELLRKARLKRGRQLLEKGGKNISEIAYEVGFSAPSYFTKCFKDEFGISPSEI